MCLLLWSLTCQNLVLSVHALHLCDVTRRVEQPEFAEAVRTFVFAEPAWVDAERTGFFGYDQGFFGLIYVVRSTGLFAVGRVLAATL